MASKPTHRLLGALRRCTRRGAASHLDSAPPTGLPHPSLGADENQSTPDRSSRGAEAVLTVPLGSPDSTAWEGSRARGSTTFTAGLRMKTVRALLWGPDFLLQGVTHTCHVSANDRPATRSHSAVPKLRRDAVAFTAVPRKLGMGKHPQHPVSPP